MIDGKKLIPSSFVKCLVYIDCHLNWKFHQFQTSSKLSRAVGMCKVRQLVSQQKLHVVYLGIFSSVLMNGSQIWGQQNSLVKIPK